MTVEVLRASMNDKAVLRRLPSAVVPSGYEEADFEGGLVQRFTI